MKETLLSLFLNYVMPVLLTGLFALVGWAFVKLSAWLHEKAQSSKLARLGATISDLAASVVAELNATLRPQLEAALKDGVLTDAEKAQLKSTAFAVLKNKLPGPLQALAVQFFGSAVDTWLAGHVERAVAAQAALAAVTPKPIDTSAMLTPPLGSPSFAQP